MHFFQEIEKKSAELFIEKYNENTAEVKTKCLNIFDKLNYKAKQSNPESCMEEIFPHWITFWWNLVRGTGQAGVGTGANMIYTTIKSSFQLVATFDDAAITGLTVGGGIFRTLSTAWKSLHIVGAVVGILLIPLDIFTMVDSAIDVHKKNKYEVSVAIRNLAKQIEEECPTKDQIQIMIDETLKDLKNID